MTSDEEQTSLHRKQSKVVMYSELNLSPYKEHDKNDEHENEELQKEYLRLEKELEMLKRNKQQPKIRTTQNS